MLRFVITALVLSSVFAIPVTALAQKAPPTE